jgi:transposase
MYTRQIGDTRRVFTDQGPAYHRVHLIGPHPILNHFLDLMNFFQLVRSCLGTRHKSILDHAQTLSVFMQNIILSPAPLYRISEWVQPIDPVALRLTTSEKRSLNDDRVARSLDALVTMRARTLFFQLALHIIEQFELDTDRIHHDTTTITFSGLYKSSKQTPRITQGMSKDHRPDLKQLVFGLNVTSDGAVPISHDIYSGNRSDDTIHQSNVDMLRKVLRREDFIYVADSKLATRKNLAHVAEYGGKFVTILPRTRVEDKRFRKSLREGNAVRWRKLLELENNRIKSDLPDIYYSTAKGPGKTSEGYRVVWIRSSQKTEIDALAREKSLEKAESELFALNTRLNTRKLRNRQAIQKKVNEILGNFNCKRFLNVRIASKTHIEIKRLRRGRPGKNDPVKRIRTQKYHLKVNRKKEALRAESRTDGVFPLITNLESNEAPKKEILRIYKYQPYVEKRHALFKSELEAAPVYIKKPQRAAGLVHAVFLAMTLDALIERTVRLGMIKESIDSLPILPEGRETKTPTTARILEMFSNVCWYEFERRDEIVTFPIQLSPLQKQLLRLLGMSQSAYT